MIAVRQFMKVPVKSVKIGDRIADLCGHQLIRVKSCRNGTTVLTLKDSFGQIRQCPWPGNAIRVWS